MNNKNMGGTTATTLRRKAVALALGGALLIAPATGAVGAMAQPSQAVAQSVTVAGSGSGSIGQASVAGVAAVSSNNAVSAIAITAEAQKRIPIGPVLDWIKRNASHIWSSMKTAVKKGWSAFKKWWYSLSSWIRWSIDFLASGGLWELFDALRHYFF